MIATTAPFYCSTVEGCVSVSVLLFDVLGPMSLSYLMCLLRPPCLHLASVASSLLLPLFSLWRLPGFGPVGENVSGGFMFRLGLCLLIKVATCFDPGGEILKGSRLASASPAPHTNSSNRSEKLDR